MVAFLNDVACAQVYSLDPYYGRAALSGTAEMAIGGYLVNKTVDPADLPLRLAAVSRCYRAETSKVKEEKGDLSSFMLS